MQTNFATWLKKNRPRMPVRLVAGRRLSGSRQEYRFPDASPCLRVWVGRTAFEVVVIYRRQHMDIVVEFDAFLKRNTRGLYYCDGCRKFEARTNGHARYEKDCMALLAEHSFEPFRDWCERNIRGDRCLVIEGQVGLWSAARILPKDRIGLKPSGRSFYVVAPVVRTR